MSRPSALDPAALDQLRRQFEADLAAAATARDLQAVRDRYLGRRSGLVPALLKEVATAPPEVRPAWGRLVNEFKQQVEAQLKARQAVLDALVTTAEAVDVTLAGRQPVYGHRHPLTLVRERIEEIFTRMGFEILDGPELEDDYHNFEALNMPPDHPARDMQDTFYLARPVGQATLLRTHTSGMQIRYMETHRPPVRIIAPGRVFRRDNPEPSKSPVFQQVEGLVVDEGVSLADLKGTLIAFVHALFGPETPVRFRPSYFPYTEPSVELDIGCFVCGQTGCPVCKRSGWVEVLGSGMVHPYLFEKVGYDPERYTGWAFGMGIERIAMLRHGVEDIRLFYANDLRFLEQFPY